MVLESSLDQTHHQHMKSLNISQAESTKSLLPVQGDLRCQFLIRSTFQEPTTQCQTSLLNEHRPEAFHTFKIELPINQVETLGIVTIGPNSGKFSFLNTLFQALWDSGRRYVRHPERENQEYWGQRVGKTRDEVLREHFFLFEGCPSHTIREGTYPKVSYIFIRVPMTTTSESHDADLFITATKLKEEGNGFWGKKNVSGAFQKWNEGRQILAPLIDSNINSTHKQLYIQLLTNLALYHLKNITIPTTPIPSTTSSPISSSNSFITPKEDDSASAVVGLCSEVLSLQLEGQHNSKAHYRRGLAQKSLGRLSEAKRDLQQAFKLSPRDTEIQRSLEPFLLPDGVTLEHSTEKGRCLITTKQVQEKQLVFKEERFVRSKTTFNKNHRDGYRNSSSYLRANQEVAEELIQLQREGEVISLHSLPGTPIEKPSGFSCTSEEWRRANDQIQTNSYDQSVGNNNYHIFLMPIGSLINHSCWPNSNIDSSTGQLVALTPLATSTEVTVSYNRDLYFESPPQRKHHIQQLFEFECRCIRCAPVSNRLHEKDVLLMSSEDSRSVDYKEMVTQYQLSEKFSDYFKFLKQWFEKLPIFNWRRCQMRLKVLDFLLSLKEPDVCLVAFLLFEQIEAETQLLPRWCSERLYYLNYFDYLFNSSLLPSQQSFDPSTLSESETSEIGGTQTWIGRGGSGAKKKEWNYQSDYRELLQLYPSQNRIPEHRFQLPKDWQKRGKKNFLKTEFV